MKKTSLPARSPPILNNASPLNAYSRLACGRGTDLADSPGSSFWMRYAERGRREHADCQSRYSIHDRLGDGGFGGPAHGGCAPHRDVPDQRGHILQRGDPRVYQHGIDHGGLCEPLLPSGLRDQCNGNAHETDSLGAVGLRSFPGRNPGRDQRHGHGTRGTAQRLLHRLPFCVSSHHPNSCHHIDQDVCLPYSCRQ